MGCLRPKGFQDRFGQDREMTNVSQGGKEDGRSPPGAKTVEVHASLCGWTKDCEETGSPEEAKKRETQRQNHSKDRL